MMASQIRVISAKLALLAFSIKEAAVYTHAKIIKAPYLVDWHRFLCEVVKVFYILTSIGYLITSFNEFKFITMRFLTVIIAFVPPPLPLGGRH